MMICSASPSLLWDLLFCPIDQKFFSCGQRLRIHEHWHDHIEVVSGCLQASALEGADVAKVDVHEGAIALVLVRHPLDEPQGPRVVTCIPIVMGHGVAALRNRGCWGGQSS